MRTPIAALVPLLVLAFLTMLRYDAEGFGGLSRATFLRALVAEGIPASGGYRPLNKEPFVSTAMRSRGFRRAFPEAVLAARAERTACPLNDRLCDEAVWLPQNVLLGPRSAMDQIADAVRKVKAHADALARA